MFQFTLYLHHVVSVKKHFIKDNSLRIINMLNTSNFIDDAWGVLWVIVMVWRALVFQVYVSINSSTVIDSLFISGSLQDLCVLEFMWEWIANIPSIFPLNWCSTLSLFRLLTQTFLYLVSQNLIGNGWEGATSIQEGVAFHKLSEWDLLSSLIGDVLALVVDIVKDVDDLVSDLVISLR